MRLLSAVTAPSRTTTLLQPHSTLLEMHLLRARTPLAQWRRIRKKAVATNGFMEPVALRLVSPAVRC